MLFLLLFHRKKPEEMVLGIQISQKVYNITEVELSSGGNNAAILY